MIWINSSSGQRGKRARSASRPPSGKSSSPTSTGTRCSLAVKNGTKHFWIRWHAKYSCQGTLLRWEGLSENVLIGYWEPQISSLIWLPESCQVSLQAEYCRSLLWEMWPAQKKRYTENYAEGFPIKQPARSYYRDTHSCQAPPTLSELSIGILLD